MNATLGVDFRFVKNNSDCEVTRLVTPNNTAPHLSLSASGAVQVGSYRSSGYPTSTADVPPELAGIVGLVEIGDGTLGGRSDAKARLLHRVAALAPSYDVVER